mgnify:CR=1 FL=1|jgi:hypothetical protein
MDIGKILTELKEERKNIDEAIIVLERLARGAGRRRGRPPSWLSAAAAADAVGSALPKRRGRPPGSKNKAQVEA